MDLVRVAPAVAEPGLLPLGYPDPAPLHALPTAPHPDNPQVFLPRSAPAVPWPDLGVPVLSSHSGIMSKPYCRACQKEHSDFSSNESLANYENNFIGEEEKKVVPLATGLSSCKFQRPAVNNSVRASKLQGYFIVESVRQPK